MLEQRELDAIDVEWIQWCTVQTDELRRNAFRRIVRQKSWSYKRLYDGLDQRHQRNHHCRIQRLQCDIREPDLCARSVHQVWRLRLDDVRREWRSSATEFRR